MSETCTEEISDRFSNAIHLLLHPHPSGSQLPYGDMGDTKVDALSIDLYNSRGYIRLEISSRSPLVDAALTDDFVRCWAQVLYNGEIFVEGPVIDIKMFKWSKEQSIIQFDIDLSRTLEEWKDDRRGY
jgi:hypothetical protein